MHAVLVLTPCEIVFRLKGLESVPGAASGLNASDAEYEPKSRPCCLATADASFADKRLVMHVRKCSADTIRIPFHVGEDRSRTWVLTRTDDGLRLKHDHRHEDGSDDAITMYGGDTASAGTATRQEFPVDTESVTMFTAADMTVSNNNTWAMEIEPGQTFVYELARPGGRLFRVEFDLTAPVELPPAPWGSEG